MPRDTLSGIAYIHISISHQAKPNSNSSARTASSSINFYVCSSHAKVPIQGVGSPFARDCGLIE